MVVAVVGLKDAIAGSTVSDDKEMQTFEKIVHYSDPVVTIAVEANPHQTSRGSSKPSGSSRRPDRVSWSRSIRKRAST